MAIAQRFRQPVPPPILTAIGVVALVLGVVVLLYAWVSATSPSSVPYSQFLGDVENGRLTHVIHSGTTLEASGPYGAYRVTLPSVLTDIYGDIEAAAVSGGSALPLFSAQPEPDTSWLGLVLSAVLPFGLLLAAVGLVVLFVVRPARVAAVRTLTGRLRQLDEAYRAGLITDDERARQRTRILDEA